MKKTNCCCRYKTLFIIPVAILLLYSGCRKEHTENELDILYSKDWKPGFIDKNPGTNPGKDVTYHHYDECEKDDIYRFLSSGKVIIKDGEKKCDASGDGQTIKNFTYDTATKKLTIDNETYFMAELTGEQVKYYAVIPYASGYGYIVYLLQ